jgi:hypothetical protein
MASLQAEAGGDCNDKVDTFSPIGLTGLSLYHGKPKGRKARAGYSAPR